MEAPPQGKREQGNAPPRRHLEGLFPGEAEGHAVQAQRLGGATRAPVPAVSYVGPRQAPGWEQGRGGALPVQRQGVQTLDDVDTGQGRHRVMPTPEGVAAALRRGCAAERR
ncbi:Hypothetical protein CAP_5170 [Chondromyces apiculatus DSM 436]|uniref:Uncharacterized protein n=1 Tax=Chondromyces apiculatus DSM 436 TaxID=1192034 RepID=A0A017T4J9_9BACT|nr:Hypothetical protein CAP_5170 [Chondromyces apiculatus DSM 436]